MNKGMKMPTRKALVLTPFQQDILQTQGSSHHAQGTVVEDVERLLGILGEGGVPVSGTKKHFSLPLLAEINSQLSHPVQLALKRPVQKSYPHINALYLLVRATGIAMLASGGKKHQMVLDTALLKAWQGLNPIERYFSLFEAWWCRGSDEIIGEEEGQGMLDPLFRCFDFIIRLPLDGINLAGKKNELDRLKYRPGHHSLALLELFGFLTIQVAAPEKGQGWLPQSIIPTAWGRAVMETVYLTNQVELDFLVDASVAEIKASAFEQWRIAFQPSFPDWKISLPSPEMPFQQGVHVVRVSFGKAWRKIALSGKSTFAALAETILDAFDFYNDHLYRFISHDRYGIKRSIHHPALGAEEGGLFTDQTRLGELSLSAGMEMIFFFDFGDSWEFQVVVEETDSKESDGSKPVVLQRNGKGPEQYPKW